ncbi:MAG: hypothetical protein V4543_13450 [Bacteroidota bacterium]
MENVTLPVYITFAFTSLLTLILFTKAVPNKGTTLVVLAIWLLLQSVLAFTGFYTHTDVLPPRFMLAVLPPVILSVTLFFTASGRNYLDSLDIKFLTLLSLVRIPVELVLLWLFLSKAVPQIMTFEGRNLDILSGISAPVIYLPVFKYRLLGRSALLLWNFICLGLLLNIVSIAILSAPFPFQKFGFEQPNVAVLNFPFVWLPCCIVPLVFISHLAAIRQLIVKPGVLNVPAATN